MGIVNCQLTGRPAAKKCMLQIGETKVVGDLRRQTLSDFKIGRVHFWRRQTASKKLTPIDPLSSILNHNHASHVHTPTSH
jgi:hypothetical protein